MKGWLPTFLPGRSFMAGSMALAAIGVATVQVTPPGIVRAACGQAGVESWDADLTRSNASVACKDGSEFRVHDGAIPLVRGISDACVCDSGHTAVMIRGERAMDCPVFCARFESYPAGTKIL